MSWHQLLILGHLGDDPTLRYTEAGTAVCNFSVAVTDRWTDKSGQKRERTSWYQISAFGKLAENCNQYLTKGRSAMVIGTPSAKAYQRRNGEWTASLNVTAKQVQFVGGGDRRQQQPQQQSNSPGDDIPW